MMLHVDYEKKESDEEESALESEESDKSTVMIRR